MTGALGTDEMMRLVYLGLLGAAILGWFIMSNRGRLGRAASQAAVWGLIFLGAIAAYGLWDDIQSEIRPTATVLGDGRMVIPRGRDGHYHVTALVNGSPVPMIVDTGASGVVLSRDDAERAGLEPERLAYVNSAQTASGMVAIAQVRLDQLQIGDFVDDGLFASVTEGDQGLSLLGMDYLSRLSHIEITGGEMILTR
ncbi:retropepsin-like aspartic protease family protein [Pseudoroseicyclus tamaricis]|uniref:TIGR02281 family clan AA aspartic protease n=1 Tax=Pseudoroseicyclus tamaricis TaxID=2705421 RepID=A0A6B2JYD0_9RHOB|nr:TIGR02281 family clan AA aspartic protease [Pseudoroseicyclus tamaricis]NDV01619.1 TIGR02281 family clan AA aspartic protease [Pseudoroseicyclus tamaricis]